MPWRPESLSADGHHCHHAQGKPLSLSKLSWASRRIPSIRHMLKDYPFGVDSLVAPTWGQELAMKPPGPGSCLKEADSFTLN